MERDKIYEDLTTLIVKMLYEEAYPQEKYLVTADYINGKEDRAWKHYKRDSYFHAKVDTCIANIMVITKR
ncbi:MAG: hypothetical protein HQ579_02910 [Candidatus Omnitrophica bacterium]|nr:hypothetical protein [Candidatus Omnitrophota bacterium]